MATTLKMTTATQIIANTDSRMFPVAKSKMRNEKQMAVIIPVVAERRKALSDSIQHQDIPPVWTADYIDSGAFLR